MKEITLKPQKTDNCVYFERELSVIYILAYCNTFYIILLLIGEKYNYLCECVYMYGCVIKWKIH